MAVKDSPVEEQSVITALDPTRHEEDPGLHPVQPEPCPVLDREDLAPEVREMKDCLRQENIMFPASEEHKGSEPEACHNDPARICGLRRLTFWLLFGTIMLLVVTGAAVGGVVGSRAHHDDSVSSTPSAKVVTISSTTKTATGTATAVPVVAQVGSGLTMLASPDLPTDGDPFTLLVYRQDPAGNIIEGQHPYPDFVQSSHTTVVPAAAVTPGSPLSAITWKDSANVPHERALFYVGNNGTLMTTNRTSLDWSQPYDILCGNDTVADGTIGLAACVDTNIMKGIRVYYVSSGQYIAEAGKQFDGSADSDVGWTVDYDFHPAKGDIESGFACTFVGSSMRLYYRNTNTSNLGALRWDYSSPDAMWLSDATPDVRIHSFNPFVDIAATDGTLDVQDVQSRFDNIVWQDQNANLVWAQNIQYQLRHTKVLHRGALGSKIAMFGNAKGRWVIYQNQTDQSRTVLERMRLGEVDVGDRSWLMEMEESFL